MEEKRHDRELKFRLEMRREEREHELRVLQMMMQTRGCNSQWTTPGQQESEYCVGGRGGQKTPIAPGTFFVSESSNKK